MDPGPCLRVRCIQPIHIRYTGQGNGVRGSTYCSASLCATDYDHYECRAFNMKIQYVFFSFFNPVRCIYVHKCENLVPVMYCKTDFRYSVNFKAYTCTHLQSGEKTQTRTRTHTYLYLYTHIHIMNKHTPHTHKFLRM